MSDSPVQHEPVGRDKMARTMRIDIAPESLLTPDPIQKTSRRIITRRATAKGRRLIDQAQTPQTEAPPTSDPESQELFRNLYDAAIISDMEGNVMDANARAAAFFSYSVNELKNLSVINLISGVDASLIDTIRQNLVERFVLIEACYCVRKDDSSFPAEIAVSQIRLSGKDALCFFVRDITARREQEERLRVEHNAVQNSGSGIVITDQNFLIRYVNPSVCRMWGYAESAELDGKDVRCLWEHTPDNEDLTQSIVFGKESWMRELVARRKDGQKFHVQATASANRDSDGRPIGMVLSFVDISDRARAEEAVREAERRRVMLESLGAACHHLGQPATVLLANLGIMDYRTRENGGELRGMVQSCLEAAESLSEILHRLNATNEYRTTPYLQDSGAGAQSHIIDIDRSSEQPPLPPPSPSPSA